MAEGPRRIDAGDCDWLLAPVLEDPLNLWELRLQVDGAGLRERGTVFARQEDGFRPIWLDRQALQRLHEVICVHLGSDGL